MYRWSFVFVCMFAQAAVGADVNRLSPVLAVPGKVVFQSDFSDNFVVGKNHDVFKCGQGTQWRASGGVLVGSEPTPEYQAKKKAAGNGHLGTAPRLQIVDSPKNVILKYSFKIDGGRRTKLLPMIESGHHLRRVYFGSEGSEILVDHEEKTIAKNDFVLQQGRWYHVMLEIVDDVFLLQVQDGPTLYGKDPGVGATFDNYNIGITATDKGTILIDNMTLWVADGVRKDWSPTKAVLSK